MTENQERNFGLALSGGGSRAAAFHRGTLRGLNEVGLTKGIGTVSTVSGGSVFGASWLAARARNRSDEGFLTSLRDTLARGFVRPALANWRLLQIALPGQTRTHRLGETFDECLFEGLSFDQLPQRPVLCMNTTILNNGQVGRFSQGGFSAAGVGKFTQGSYPEGLVEGLSLGMATVSSAAYPFGLPPLSLAAKRFAFPLTGALDGHQKLVLTDGGILENLGVQTLLRSKRFGTKHIVLSDAGAAEKAWKPSGLFGRLRGAIAYGLAPDILERLLLIMSNKLNRSMRQLLFQELANAGRAQQDRRVLFVMLSQDWDQVIRSIPPWRLVELGVQVPASSGVEVIESALESVGVNLAAARQVYDDMKGPEGVKAANDVKTSFSALGSSTLDVLEAHARWQVHVLAALYL